MQMNSNIPAPKNQAENSPISENIVTRKIGEIILDPKINTREVARDVVTDYKEAMQGYGAKWQDHWNELPRITETNHLWSGFHTICAAIEIFGERTTVKCHIEGENERDAYFLATRANAQHGRRRTNLEKQTSVDRWLNDEEMNQWTDGYIAKLCRVTQPFVSNRRLKSIMSQPTKRKFINAKGDIEWMHTTRIGKTQTPPTIGKPNVNFKEVEDAIVEKASDTEPIPPSPNLQSFDDEYPNISTEDLIEKQEKLRGEVFKFAIETNGLPPGNLLIDWNRLLSHAEKQHKGIIRDELVDPDRDKLINQIKIWSHFAYQAGVASDIFVAMLANFDYEMAKRDGKRFPDLEECNWIVDLGLPNVLKEIISRTQNRYSNSQSDLGLASLPFYDDPGFYSYAEKQYPRYLVKSHPALDTAEDRESNLGAIKTWYALEEDIRNRADWIQDIKREIDDDLAKEAAAEDGPDLQGLREEIDDCIVNGEKIETEELSKKYDVPIKQVNLEAHLIQQEKGKYGLMNAYDDLASKGWSIWDQHLKRFISWKGLYEAAQSNWPALADWDEYSPSDESEESLKLQVAIWRNFNADLDYAVRAIKKEGTERGNIWLLKLLVIDVEPKPDSDQTENNDKQKRDWTMEEVEDSYDSIEGEIGDLSEEEQIQVRQFLKVNYDAYPTYGWRDRLKAEALEALAETLDSIHRGIKEKGLEAFKLSPRNPDASGPSDPSAPPSPTELQIEPVSDPEPEKILLEDDTYTKEHLLNCKRSITELTELQGVPLIIKFAAEEFLETIEKALLVKDKEVS